MRHSVVSTVCFTSMPKFSFIRDEISLWHLAYSWAVVQRCIVIPRLHDTIGQPAVDNQLYRVYIQPVVQPVV